MNFVWLKTQSLAAVEQWGVYNYPILFALRGKQNKRSPVKKSGTGIRLKHQSYGEVLTTQEVLERLKQAEKQKAKKAPKRKNDKQSENPGKGRAQEKSRKSNNKQKKIEEDTESEEERLDPTVLESNDEEDFDSYLQNLETEELEEVAYKEPAGVNIQPDMFVLVELLGGKRTKTKYLYLCRVDEVSNEIGVTGLKSVNNGKSKFTLTENDQFSVSWDQVKAILPTPQV